MAGGTMTDVRSVAANTITANIVAGKVFEFVQRPSIVRFYIVSAAVAVLADVLVGNESYVQGEEVSAANRFPIRNEDLLIEMGALPGERIVVRLNNTTGAAIVVKTLIEVIPVT